jgi:hypothetical protein
VLVRKRFEENVSRVRNFVVAQRRDAYRLRPPFFAPFFLVRFPLTASLSDRPATNAATLRAGILIFSPDFGLRPSRARR